jgi:hypothetical protein
MMTHISAHDGEKTDGGETDGRHFPSPFSARRLTPSMGADDSVSAQTRTRFCTIKEQLYFSQINIRVQSIAKKQVNVQGSYLLNRLHNRISTQ